MAEVTAKYSSPTHSVTISHPVHSSDGSQKSSLNALRQAILSTQADLNVFLTERKLEEDSANGVNGTASKRKAPDDEGDEENNDEENEGVDEDDEE